MEFKEITAELEKFKDSDEYKSYVGGFITADRVTKYLETEDGKKYIQPILDRYHTKGLESWKTNSLPKLLDEEVRKKLPEVDPRDTELANLKAEVNAIKAQKAREELKNKATKALNDKQMPLSVVDFIIGEDENTTNSNIAKLTEVFSSHVNTEIDKRLKSNTYIPPKNNKKDGSNDPFLEGLGLK